jgi:ABC-type sugar transport system ATPase subunit
VSQLSPGAKVTLGIRPRNLEICQDPVEDSLSTKIDMVEPMGAETLAHMNDGYRDLRVVTDWRVPLAEGDHVHLRFPPGVTHIFTEDEQVLRSAT